MFHSFITNLTSSIYNPAFYARVLSGERMRTKSFVCLFSLFAAGWMCIMFAPFLSHGIAVVQEAPQYVEEIIPNGMTLALSAEGELSVLGVEEPVTIPFPRALSEDSRVSQSQFMQSVKSLAIIDTRTAYSTEAHRTAQTLVWLGKTEIASLEDGGQVSVGRYTDVLADSDGVTDPSWKGGALSKSQMVEGMKAVAGYSQYLWFLLPVLFVVGALAYALGMVLFGVIVGALIYVIAKIFPAFFSSQGAVRYTSAMRAAIFAGVLPNIIMLVSWLTPVSISYGMYAIGVIVIVLCNVRAIVKK